ncbi:MAG: prepilin-type N-terminal cleavage/methylation domain-containing protein [Desulfamplus sp.]|nr:prepilin-type N-terminal cleavage/methylation domain-containing protein [Desulfamplus sp.]
MYCHYYIQKDYRQKDHRQKDHRQKGFSLIEILIAMAIASILSLAMYSFNTNQTRSHVTQEAIVEMNQNVRAALHFMSSEIRMAGCDPSGDAGAGFLTNISGYVTTPSSTAIAFSMDFTGGEADGIDNDGDGVVDDSRESYDGQCNSTGEMVRYRFDAGTNRILRGYWINDPGPLNPYTGWSTDEELATAIDALNFVYLDENGSVWPPAGGDPADIRTVQITVVARSGTVLPGFMLTHRDPAANYQNQQNDVIYTPPDEAARKFRRIVLTAEVKVRNMGLM